MRRSLAKVAEELRLYWRNYVGQSLLATVAMLGVFLVIKGDRTVLLASMGATAFIVFAMPRSVTAGARNVIGGHLVGLLCGLAVAALPDLKFPFFYVVCSLSVGLSFFIMVVTDTEHPPAAGTALAIALRGASEEPGLTAMVIAVLSSAMVLSATRWLLRKHLRDLV